METLISMHDRYSKQYPGCGNLIVFYNDNRENINLIKLLPIIKHYVIDNGHLIVLQYDYTRYNTQKDFYDTILEFASETRIKNLVAYSKLYGNSYSLLMCHHFIYLDCYYEISIYNNYINTCIDNSINSNIINVLSGNKVESIHCNLRQGEIHEMLFANKLFDVYINTKVGANINDYIYNYDSTICNFDDSLNNLYDNAILELGLKNLYM